VHDFIRIATRRFPGVRLAVYPVSVQGDQAAAEMIQAIELLTRQKKTDVIVLCRGGGSLEDLMPYNDEQLARTIYRADLPVVSAVGHEIDFTIADFVSDLRAPTPSAAAELLVPDREALAARIAHLRTRLIRVQQSRLDRLSEQLLTRKVRLSRISAMLEAMMQRLDQRSMTLIHAMQARLNVFERRIERARLGLEQQNPVARLKVAETRLTSVRQRLARSMEQILAEKNQRLAQHKQLLSAVSPKNTLARGYAIMQDQKGAIISSSSQVQVGDRARVLLHQGSVQVKIETVE
jgi:exodeoxyribonuclease VII large subunit